MYLYHPRWLSFATSLLRVTKFALYPKTQLNYTETGFVFFNPYQHIKESTSPDELAEWILWARVQIVRLIVNILEFFDLFFFKSIKS